VHNLFGFIFMLILWLNMFVGMAFTGMFDEEFMSTRWGGAIQFFI